MFVTNSNFKQTKLYFLVFFCVFSRCYMQPKIDNAAQHTAHRGTDLFFNSLAHSVPRIDL